MPMAAGENLFRIIEHQLHRPLGRLRQMVGDRHIDQRSFAAEVTADMNDVNLNSFLGHAKIFRHLFAQAPGAFVRSPDLHSPVGVNMDGAGAWLEITMMRKRRAESMLKHSCSG